MDHAICFLHETFSLFSTGMEESIYANLSSVPNMNIYRKTEIPSEYKYTYNVRIPPLLLVAEPNYTFCLENCSSISEYSFLNGFSNDVIHLLGGEHFCTSLNQGKISVRDLFQRPALYLDC